MDDRRVGLVEDYDVDDSRSLPLHTRSLGHETFDSPANRLSEQDLTGRSTIRRSRFGRTFHALASLGGSGTHRPHTIKPWLPELQTFPVRWFDRRFPKYPTKISVFLIASLCWVVAFGFTTFLTEASLSANGHPIQPLDCVDRFWLPGNGCGLDGQDCRPFEGTSIIFRCPSHCAGVQVLNPYSVGGAEVNYRSLVIGGPVYRADSFICGSAIHAGVVSNSRGGCGVVSKTGQSLTFGSSKRNGINSISLDTYFPSTFTVTALPRSRCRILDLHWAILPVSLIFTTIVSVFTTSAALHFFTSYTAIFIHVGLISDPPTVTAYTGFLVDRPLSVLPGLISILVGRLLPATACAIVLYYTCIKRTLEGLTAQVEKTIFWLGAFWFGALSNYTFEALPISRLTSHDLEQQPGAKLALFAIVCFVVAAIIFQALDFRVEGRLGSKLGQYSAVLGIVLISLMLPGLELRLHHYIFSLMLLPGTSMQTRRSLIYQGLLLGLFVNGIARWGFDPFLQTPGALRDGGAFGSLIPALQDPIVTLNADVSSATFSWIVENTVGFDGLSVLVNDVERERIFFHESSSMERNYNFTWTRNSSVVEYFRVAYLTGARSLDYSSAGTWHANGSWSTTMTSSKL